tara:strand:- start:236 stop:931 length:696 start_codon:yes stop_codon:yes gene_type:complete
MKKLLSALLVSFSMIALPNSVQAVDLSVSLGAASASGGYHAVGQESIRNTGGVNYNSVSHTEEAGVFTDSHQSIFAEVNIGDNMAVGVEFAMGDIQTPTNTNAQLDKTSAAGSGSVKTNTAKASFSDKTTVYIQARMLGGLYTRVMYHNVNLISEETLNTGGAYGDATIEGLGFGLGYQHDFDDLGVFVRLEANASAYESVKAHNTNDVHKTISVSDLYGAEGSIRIGKTF